MKHITILTLFFLIGTVLNAQIISKKGYPEHFIGGAIIGGVTSSITFKKTNNKLIAWGTGLVSSTVIGLFKEWVDPVLFNGTRNNRDLLYTSLGGGVGASIVIPFQSRRDKQAASRKNKIKKLHF